MSTPTSLSKSLDNLRISPAATPTVLKKKALRTTKEEPLDSWETASLSSDDEEETPTPPGSHPPPPTPTTPILSHRRASSATLGSPAPRAAEAEAEQTPALGSPAPRAVARETAERSERPTTTDAVARRMISAALGVRTRSTKEQREFDAAVREKERKRKEEEKRLKREEELRLEAAKRSIWED